MGCFLYKITRACFAVIIAIFMAEKLVTVTVGLMDIVKGIISRLVVEILTKRNLSSSHCVSVFGSKVSAHGDLLIRKEFLMNVLKEYCSVDHQLKVVA